MPARIVIEPNSNPSTIMVERLKALPEYKDVFISADTAMLEADNHSPVSYTHLDVYKRQPPGQLPAPGRAGAGTHRR